MTNLTVALAIGLVAAVYFIGKNRGERKKAKQIMSREAEFDRKESEDALAKKRAGSVLDNLNDTISGKR